jgi:glycosyltransferase involved in cell wall biosynthesis
MPPSVSVIVPNYRHAHYLRQRIDSILAQTFEDYEILLLDDCSPDNSREVLESYRGHPRVSQIVYNQENSGSAFKQWNKGVGLAKGKYIWMAESDDWASPELLGTLVPMLMANPKAGVAYCQSMVTDEHGQVGTDAVVWTQNLHPTRWYSDYVADGKEEVANYLLWQNTIPNASAVVFAKEIFLQAGRAPEQLKMCGDWWLWAHMLESAQVAYSAQRLNFFRTHAGTTRNLHNFELSRQRLAEEFAVYNYIASTIDQPSLVKRKHQLVYQWVQLYAPQGQRALWLNPPPGSNLLTYWRELAGYFRHR